MDKPKTAEVIDIHCANCGTANRTIVTGYEVSILIICRKCGQVVICDLAVNNE